MTKNYNELISDELNKIIKRIIRLKAKEEEKTVHCIICGADYSKQCWNHHMKTKKHINNLKKLHKTYCDALSFNSIESTN